MTKYGQTQACFYGGFIARFFNVSKFLRFWYFKLHVYADQSWK